MPRPAAVEKQSDAPLESLGAIEAQVRRLAARLTPPPRWLPTFGTSRHDGTPHIEVGDSYFFVTCERGVESERRPTSDLDELLFWIYSSVTFSLASDWEMRHRYDGKDCRRKIFARQVELLAALSPQWAAREAEDHRLILERHPFSDR